MAGTYVTEVTKFDKFWAAEQYHQGYYNENPTHRIAALW
jgi:peptide-methionine (S)-S-oxide reductase